MASRTPQRWSGWPWVSTTCVTAAGETPAALRLSDELSRRGLVAWARACVHEDHVRLAADRRDVVHEPNLVAAVPGCLQCRLALDRWSVRGHHETRWKDEMTIAHHQCFKVGRLMDRPEDLPTRVERNGLCVRPLRAWLLRHGEIDGDLPSEHSMRA